MSNDPQPAPSDIFIIGGGINGCAIARDAAGRGLSVTLAEMGDLAGATSSASTKLFHGGLRYLEFFEFKLVRHALQEREALLRTMPHISWPMRFVLPYHPDMRFDTSTPASRLVSTIFPWLKGRRPAWMIRMGLFLYDHLGGREILPGTRSVDLRDDPVGKPLKSKFQKAYEYSDCWVEDSRLVALNARDARKRGATILTRTCVVSASFTPSGWEIETVDTETGAAKTHLAKMIVNAGGPWVEKIIRGQLGRDTTAGIRLVRGSHIVTRKLFNHEKCYFFQGQDGRIVFAIPYETDFTLIGTTDLDHGHDPGVPAIATDEEQAYLCTFASQYFERPVTREEIVWTYSGVRPLYDDGATSATAATRDYVLSLDVSNGPILSVFGGKITTNRILAEQAVEKMRAIFPSLGSGWTRGVPMPGGDFAVTDFPRLCADLARTYGFLTEPWAKRLARAYGTEAARILRAAKSSSDLGIDFGATLFETEVRWLMENELARRAEDIVWRRSKLGLRMSREQIETLDAWMRENGSNRPGATFQ